MSCTTFADDFLEFFDGGKWPVRSFLRGFVHSLVAVPILCALPTLARLDGTFRSGFGVQLDGKLRLLVFRLESTERLSSLFGSISSKDCKRLLFSLKLNEGFSRTVMSDSCSRRLLDARLAGPERFLCDCIDTFAFFNCSFCFVSNAWMTRSRRRKVLRTTSFHVEGNNVCAEGSISRVQIGQNPCVGRAKWPTWPCCRRKS